MLLALWGHGPHVQPTGVDGVRTGVLNVAEAVHVLLRAGKATVARQALAAYWSGAETLSPSRVSAAAALRVRHPERGLSLVDAMGYATALELGAPFFTTDRGFRGLPGAKVLGV